MTPSARIYNSHAFTYDALSRLTDATHPAGSGLPTERFRYDAVGNRTTSHLSATHRHDAGNRLLEDATFTYGYDPNGNRTTRTRKAAPAEVETWTYDPEDQVIGYTKPGTTATYRYDALGRRIEKTVNGTIVRFHYDQEDLILETDETGTPRAHWVHGPGIDEPLLMERDLNQDGAFEPTERFFYHADGLGSTVALSDSTGKIVERYRYDTFGTPTILGPGPDGQMDTADDHTLTCSAFGNPFLFTGREYDCESGLYHVRRRTLDPGTGTFLQADPIFSSNLYPYVDNNPVVLSDPFGLLSVIGQRGPTVYVTPITEPGPTVLIDPITEPASTVLEHPIRDRSPGEGVIADPITPPSSNICYSRAGKAKEKAARLPTGGKRPFIPKRQKGQGLVRDKKGGFTDRQGNSWQWDNRKQEWDIQHTDGTHTNINVHGEITHGPDNFPR